MSDYRFDVIVCYDIPDNKRRTKVHDRLQDFGLSAVQYSVFWGRLLHSELNSTRRFLDQFIKPDQDEKIILLTGQFMEQLNKQSIGYPAGSWQEIEYVSL
jgi:CRISPR-associated protein Cas2